MGEIIRLKISRRRAHRRIGVSATPAAVEVIPSISFERFEFGFDVAMAAQACASLLNSRQQQQAMQFWSDHVAAIKSAVGKRITPAELDRPVANYTLAVRAKITPLRTAPHAGHSTGRAG